MVMQAKIYKSPYGAEGEEKARYTSALRMCFNE